MLRLAVDFAVWLPFLKRGTEMLTTAQKFATIAYEQVKQIDQTKKTYCQKYGSMAHKLPILIRKAGLAQALAFLEAKNEAAYTDLLNHLAATLEWPSVQDGSQLVSASRSADLDTYILLTRRISVALIWYKRFAESILKVKPVDEAPEGGG